MAAAAWSAWRTSGYRKITALLAAGYTRDDLAKIWGGNVLRVLRQDEVYKASLAPAARPPG